MNLKFFAYRTALLKTKRGNNRGVFSNAKPLLVLAIINAIEEGVVIGNKIEFTNKELEDIYRKVSSKSYNSNCDIIRANVKVTPFNMPFFHLNAEEYYHIKWKTKNEKPSQAQSPSSKYLRENIDYAYLDPELWDLLQDPLVRDEFRKAIINHYLKEEKE